MVHIHRRQTKSRRLPTQPVLDTLPGLRPEDDEASWTLRWALAAAIGVHAVLFVLHFPNFYSPSVVEAKEVKVYRVEPFRTPPPQPPPEPTLPQVQPQRMPVPDPTPDDPEPIRPFRVENVRDLVELDVVALGSIPAAPPPAVTGPIPVTGDVQKPERIFSPQPRYTEIARRARLQGVVILQATIDAQGSVIDVQPLKGLGMGLTESAIAAVEQWRFKPATLNGKPVAVYFSLTIHYYLQ